MKFVIDMNLSPNWMTVLSAEGWEAVHWSGVGNARATDHEIMAWARNNEHIVLTHDLDFGAMLASTMADGPSVVQVRTQDIRPSSLGPLLLAVLHAHESDLLAGALLVVEASKSRIRLLPLTPRP